MIKCEFCNTKLSSVSSLKHHQRNAKYCIIKQGKEMKVLKCDACNSTFTTKRKLLNHRQICTSYIVEQKEILCNEKNNNVISTYEKRLEDKDIQINNLQDQIKYLQDKLINVTLKAVENKNNDIQWVEDIMCDNGDEENTCYKKLKEENKDIKTQIKYLINKCVKKQPRIQYKEKYVIYILTTSLMKKERRYILGKAKDLTSRLSTYNKSDEHEVIYYQSCGSQEVMACVENMVFEYLKEYREQANRERFILPEKEEIELFSNVIKKSVDFFKK